MHQKGICMTSKAIGIFLFSFLALISQTALPNTLPPTTVSQVNLQRYMGTWYEIASFPNFFQRGCKCTSATYGLKDDGTVTVHNKCFARTRKFLYIFRRLCLRHTLLRNM